MNFRLTCLAALSALVLAACGDSKEPAASTPAATATTEATATPTPFIEKVTGDPTPMPEVTPSGKDEPKVTKPEGKAPTEVVSRDLEVGKGEEIAVGKLAAVEYKGWLFDDGKVFDSTWDGGKPFQFIFGAAQVIKGWDQGLAGMKVGGRRELIIPSELAYGDHGQASIPPNATLVFVVDLVALN
ncbi:FKBP-type peptidyl-prolyl cis-trans isomerase [Solirubrobacter phytolaccae]|uniref:Peptidyl-prolyl cis-trans isomerase n=1 Tax=Solirubrobacter phytolaccae TaxID=1404360 RepID=A0A9X3NDS7_9ACTN|nr:FKBP-type peptidyl-prolyl cis-trans isomerase [Solirubrobacter phytolaccae]MDA0184588.1 FKBP-type peptidyl-prolyl cis-trans isomerase [Solirubrobacter phytolaccae]